MKMIEMTVCRPVVVFEDQHLIVINKPSCMHSADSTRSEEARDLSLSLAAWIALTFGEQQRQISKNSQDSGLVQRLDYFTSGLIIAAKSAEAWQVLRTMIQEQKVYKTYRVVLDGKLEKISSVKVALGSPYRHSKKVQVSESLNKKRTQVANTTFTPVSYIKNLNATIATVIAAEGRRHQVRACAGYLKYPLMGDDLYGSKTKTGVVTKFWLHAESIKFEHPITKCLVELVAGLPDTWP